MLITLLRGVLYALQILVMAAFAYLWIPAILRVLLAPRFSAIAHRDVSLPAGATPFVVLVPARNEERAIGALLASLRGQAYPTDLLSVFVVSDNSSDNTAAVVRLHGYTCSERRTETPSSKGQALKWLWTRLPASARAAEAVIAILDADCVLPADYFSQLDRAFAVGASVVQTNRRVARASGRALTDVEAAAEEIRMQVQCGVRRVCGLGAYLCGSGIAFRAPIFARLMAQQETETSITEDVSWQIWLAQRGIRVIWWPTATLTYEAVHNMSQFRTQRNRWVGARIRGIVRHGLPLVWQGIRRRDLGCVDQGLHLAQLPRSVLAVLAIGTAALAVAWPAGSLLPWWGWLALVASLGGYLLIGFVCLRLPPRAYASLLIIPLIVVQVAAISARTLVGRTTRRWEAIEHGTVEPGAARDRG